MPSIMSFRPSSATEIEKFRYPVQKGLLVREPFLHRVWSSAITFALASEINLASPRNLREGLSARMLLRSFSVVSHFLKMS